MTTLLSRLHHEERGAGLVAVLLLAMVMTGLVTVTMTSASQSMQRTRGEQDELAAVDAAQAGVDDYVFRLQQDSNYWSTSTPALDPTNDALDSWVPVPGAPSGSFFRYEIDISEIASSMITITSHGAAYGQVRTIKTKLRKTGFLDYLYFTEYETMDPNNESYQLADAYGLDPPDTFYATWVEWAAAECSHHRYQTWTDRNGNSRTGRPVECLDIEWSTGDVVDGWFHTNDTIAVNGDPRWTDIATTALPAGVTPRWEESGSGSSPLFEHYPDNNPGFRVRMDLPPSNADIRLQADYTIGATGCLYTGPTRIQFIGNQVKVTSPFTNATGSGCATNGTMAVRPNMVIYVQNVPAASSDPNHRTCSAHPFRYDATTTSNRLFVRGDRLMPSHYPCTAGDAFVYGQVDGRVTLAAENNIVIVDNLTLTGGVGPSSDDVLGLIANNYVEIYHPYGCLGYAGGSGNCNGGYGNQKRGMSGGVANGLPDTVWTNVTVQAAILSAAHSFQVQSYNYGAQLSDLNVTGTIAQLYRGPVRHVAAFYSTGYRKNYVYDQRLRYLAPPHFLDPVNTVWDRVSFAELPPGHPAP